MPQCCVVPLCGNKKGGHRFPKGDKVRLKKWIVAIRRETFIPTKHSIVCKNHFTADDYEPPKDSVLEKPLLKLKTDAVPSVFPWNDAAFDFKRHKEKFADCAARDMMKKEEIEKSKKQSLKNAVPINNVQTAPKPRHTNPLWIPTDVQFIDSSDPKIKGNIVKLIPVKASEIKVKASKQIPIKSPDIRVLNLNKCGSTSIGTENNKLVNQSTVNNENTSSECYISQKNMFVADKVCQINLNPKSKSIETTFTCNRFIYSDRCDAELQIEIAPKLIPIKASDIKVGNKSVTINKQFDDAKKANETNIGPEYISVSTVKKEPTMSEPFAVVSTVKNVEFNISFKKEIKTEIEHNEGPFIKEERMDEIS